MASIEPFSGPRPAWDSVGPVADEAAPDESAGQAADTGPEAVHPVDTSASGAGEPASTSPTRPSRFLGDLMRAMLATAEDAKAASVEQSRADAKAAIEGIHGRSADEASGLRRDADDDIAGIREWSKSEMARIREETERRIAGRKDELASELEAHAGRIEREIDVVQRRVSAFETNLQSFFGTFGEATDPTTLARLAERMPEPPRFDSPIDVEAELEAAEATAQREAAEASRDTGVTTTQATSAVAVMEPPAGAGLESVAAEAVAAPLVKPGEDTAAVPAVEESAGVEAVAPAIETVEPEAGTEAPVEADVVEPVEGEASAGVELVASEADESAAPADDVEPVASASPEGEATGLDAEAALEARLAGLAAVPVSERTPSIAATTATRVSVTGFVSVAGIASFKRHLSRLPGVLSVGVSSSPDGEFVFNVAHEPSLQLREILPTLPGFAVRVLKAETGALNISAHDPSADA